MTKVVHRSHGGRPRAATAAQAGLLCVSNFPANTGYAWDFIEALYAGLSDRLAGRGVRTWVAYPQVAAAPRTLAGSAAEAIELDVSLRSKASLKATMQFVRDRNIRVLYLCDRPTWDRAYVELRRAGVRRIIVHDHTSGERTVPRGLKRIIKRARMTIPGSVVDEVIAVSEFVAQRQAAVELVPRGHITRVWNSICIPEPQSGAAGRLRQSFGISENRPVVVCACRATPEKGVAVLLRAFDRMVGSGRSGGSRPVLLYLGDGPELPALQALRERLPARNDILLGGYVDNAADLIEGADLCVVPSVWHEAFGLAALEPMSRGVAVVASRVGGIPEIVEDGETGRLVDAGDEQQLATVMGDLLADATERARMGANGRARAAELFSREAQLRQLLAIVEAGFD